jgi:phospholipase/carboxylesterase
MALERMVREGDGPTLVLLHGLGADEVDLFDLGELAPPNWRIVSLRAPVPYGPGYSWFDIDWDESGLRIDVRGAEAAAQVVAQEIAVYDRPVLAGFSQGAMLTWLVLVGGAPLRGAAMIAGAPLAEGPAPEGVPALVIHGSNDPVVPVAAGRGLASLQGPRGRYLETDDPHGIGLEAQAALREWLAGLDR